VEIDLQGAKYELQSGEVALQGVLSACADMKV
jgi:hypothetical protein